MISRPLLIHLVFMASGYAAAVLSATAVVCVLMGLPTIFADQGQWGSFYRYLKDLPAMFAFGLMMTAMYGLPGWLVSVVTAEVRNERRKFWFAAAGVLTAMLAHGLSGGMNYTIFGDPFFTASIIVGGFCGGLVYWPVAGWKSGGWKRAAGLPLEAGV